MAAADERPFPPGDYPVVIVGSGPGGLQTSYFLKQLKVKHAVLSADEGPGGMFRRFPIFQRLISWTKRHAPVPSDTRDYERYDWNSLIGDTPGVGALTAGVMDSETYFPSRAEMQESLTLFADKARLRVRYGCTWESTGRDGDCFVLRTTDGDYRCRVAIFAMGMTKPWKPDIPGIENVPHYSDVPGADPFEGRRVFVIGKRNSAFELADGLLSHVREIVLASPRPAEISLNSFHVATARARYLQVYEDFVLGGGSLVLDAAIAAIERRDGGFTVHTQGTTKPGDLLFEADDVIAATGFTTPLGDLPEFGVATFNQGRLPAQTNFWESASVPNLYFAGSVTQGAAGLRKYGIPSVSGAVQGMRYNSKVLALYIAERHFGFVPEYPAVDRDDIVDVLLREAAHAPELWIQRGYLAREFSFDDDGAMRDRGVVPLAHFVDASGPPGVAVGIETGPQGDIYPAIYVRTRGSVSEHLLPPDYRHDFETAEHRTALTSALKGIL